MDKYEYIVNLAEKTAKRVSQNRESWMKFLTSAARIYPMRRKTPCFSYGDIRRVHRIYASN
jgi:hypothetical protein